MKALILCSSPRRNGNSFLLANSALEGFRAAGTDVELLFVEDYISHFLRDCRECRGADGECQLQDRFKELFLDHYVPADGVLFATPLYWYGMSGQLKTFFDRTFCYYAASHPNSNENAAGMCGKRLGVVISSEETYPSATLGIVHQLQEFSRYTDSTFVGQVRGIGNKRGDVTSDPLDPIAQAHTLGRNFFTQLSSDYKMNTPRAGSVWAEQN